MTIRVDPGQNETRALFDLVDLDGRRVLEIRSGDGRLTRLYPDRTAHVIGVEPFPPAVARAEKNMPKEIASGVALRRAFDEFAAGRATSTFDVAIFSWSLCCMSRDDRVPALEDVHRLLSPKGVVIDIHPVPGSAQVEVHRAAKSSSPSQHPAPTAKARCTQEEALTHVVARGLFAAERRADFDHYIYASSVRELRDFLAEADAHARQAGHEMRDAYESKLYERVQRLIGAEGAEAEVVYHERGRISRLRPIGPRQRAISVRP